MHQHLQALSKRLCVQTLPSTRVHTTQIAAGTVYWEWQRGVQAAEEKKKKERKERDDWEAAAEAQRMVRLTPLCPHPAPCTDDMSLQCAMYMSAPAAATCVAAQAAPRMPLLYASVPRTRMLLCTCVTRACTPAR
jgi:hypothetical protein